MLNLPSKSLEVLHQLRYICLVFEFLILIAKSTLSITYPRPHSREHSQFLKQVLPRAHVINLHELFKSRFKVCFERLHIFFERIVQNQARVFLLHPCSQLNIIVQEIGRRNTL